MIDRLKIHSDLTTIQSDFTTITSDSTTIQSDSTTIQSESTTIQSDSTTIQVFINKIFFSSSMLPCSFLSDFSYILDIRLSFGALVGYMAVVYAQFVYPRYIDSFEYMYNNVIADYP